MKLEDYNKYYIQGSDHYLIPKDDFSELVEENQELKKQLENYKKLGFKHLQDKNNNLETQQKEFINYLENEINKWHNNYDSYNYEYEIEEPTAEELLVSALSKYQEIIGNDINVGSKGGKE